MAVCSHLTAWALLLSIGAQALAQEPPAKAPPPEIADRDPLLRLEAGGPTTAVTALTFSPDGKTLYAAGFDKVVRVWRLDEKTGQFTLEPFAFRVPVGPERTGILNALAVSADSEWLAVSGLG